MEVRCVVIDESEVEEHLLHGELHREDGPARIWHSAQRGHIQEEWYLHGRRHREDGPAILIIDPHQRKEEWYLCGRRHRRDGPAVQLWILGTIREEEWYIKGKPHRIDGPAITRRTESGIILIEKWYNRGRFQRVDGPAYADYKKRKFKWYKFGTLHRVGGPAIDKIDEKCWYVDGYLHNLHGPAVVTSWCTEYWLFDRHYEKSAYEKALGSDRLFKKNRDAHPSFWK